ncbi:MAG: DUF2520 domain-containing protein, partial [Planctomycetota bacterium]|nr:DUF2520 domain-containing protein [Planctomycetota bacterium]
AAVPELIDALGECVALAVESGPIEVAPDLAAAAAALDPTTRDDEAVDVLRSVVIALDGRPVQIQGPDKALYHAGAAAASNFLVTLIDYAVTLFFQAGVPRDAALAALLPLIKGTVANLESVGLPDALTGPIARGDLGTVKRHLRALEKMPGDMARLYRLMARKTISLGVAKGSLEKEDARKLLDLLGGPDFPGEGAP